MKVVLVDAMAYIFRHYHATQRQDLRNNDGFPTGAIYGVATALDNLQKRFKDHKIVVISDHPAPTFRKEMYSEYKANRKPAPEDLKMQIDPIYEIIKAKGFHMMRVAGFEADDTIATLATKYSNKGYEVIIASADKDLMQLVNRNTKMLDAKWNIIDERAVYEKMGVEPRKISHLLAIVGDVADNVPGLKKAGIKTAAKWLNQYGDLEGIKNNAHEVGGKIGETLRDGFSDIDLSYKLTKLVFDVDIPFDPMDKDIKSNKKDLESLYRKFNLKIQVE